MEWRRLSAQTPQIGNVAISSAAFAMLGLLLAAAAAPRPDAVHAVTPGADVAASFRLSHEHEVLLQKSYAARLDAAPQVVADVTNHAFKSCSHVALAGMCSHKYAGIGCPATCGQAERKVELLGALSFKCCGQRNDSHQSMLASRPLE